ncbi:MAG: NAD(P)H-hydrate epimerase [Aeromicrobium sp.]|uniref:NAD(P)H-hydrate epimerase n=1 Tax=Aeromicrobium sp. TaxID=1871063 RepID=UPI0039E67AE8
MLVGYEVAAIRAAEERAAQHVGWDALMAQAARALADRLLEWTPADATTLFLIGPGNNGGDALYAAAHLARAGRAVRLCLLDAEKAHPAGLADARAAGAREVDAPSDEPVCVDGVFGIGARPGLTQKAAEWAAWQRRHEPFTVAVDVPSGIGVDDGTLPGVFLRADRTLTFGAFKPGLLVGPAADVAGIVEVADIGLGAYLSGPAVEAIAAGDADLLSWVAPGSRAHKYTRGVVGVRAGSSRYPGAAHLSVAGAQAGLAGYVRFVGDADLELRVVDKSPEVVAGAGRVQAWVVGSGGEDTAAEHLRAALDDEVPLVVDAAALPCLEWPVEQATVLTPHAGELASLLDVERAEVEADPWRHAREAADRWKATVLLKGRRTLVVTPGRTPRVNLSGTPWLATAGSGDVLGGLVGSLLAAGLDAHDAASLGAFFHGAAGVRANPGGPITASQIAAELPGVIADFLSGRLSQVNDW